MASDKYSYRLKETNYAKVIERLDGSIAPGELSLVQRRDGMVTYDCDWVGGAYIHVQRIYIIKLPISVNSLIRQFTNKVTQSSKLSITDNNEEVKIELDGNADGFPGVEGFLEKILKINLEDADE